METDNKSRYTVYRRVLMIGVKIDEKRRWVICRCYHFGSGRLPSWPLREDMKERTLQGNQRPKALILAMLVFHCCYHITEKTNLKEEIFTVSQFQRTQHIDTLLFWAHGWGACAGAGQKKGGSNQRTGRRKEGKKERRAPSGPTPRGPLHPNRLPSPSNQLAVRWD